MTYRTCIGCAHADGNCAELANVRRQLSGLGVTTIKWRCKSRQPRFVPGDPVWARTVVYYGDEGMEDFPATFIQTAGNKVLVKIEPGAQARNADYTFEPNSGGVGYCKIPHSRVVAREGHRVRVCKHCQELSGGHADYCRLFGAEEVA